MAHCSCVLELLWDVFLWQDVGRIELFTALLCAGGPVLQTFTTTGCSLFLEGKRRAVVRSAVGLNASTGKQCGVLKTVSPSVWNLLSFRIKIKKILEL